MSRPAALALLLACLPLVASAGEPSAPGTRLAEAETGQLWGRLALEEESPEGSFTPLIGVPITLYPALPALTSELEAIRRTARETAANYETAVQRVHETLAAYRARLEAAEGARAVRARETDRTGFFVFDAVPAGEWLVVAVHVTPYRTAAQARKPRAPKRPAPGRGLGGGLGQVPGFLPEARGEAKEADLWVYRVSVPGGQTVGVRLTDRNRWFTGPIWEALQKEKTPQGPKRP